MFNNAFSRGVLIDDILHSRDRSQAFNDKRGRSRASRNGSRENDREKPKDPNLDTNNASTPLLTNSTNSSYGSAESSPHKAITRNKALTLSPLVAIESAGEMEYSSDAVAHNSRVQKPESTPFTSYAGFPQTEFAEMKRLQATIASQQRTIEEQKKLLSGVSDVLSPRMKRASKEESQLEF